MQRALGGGPVDQRDEGRVGGGHGLGVAGLDGLDDPPERGLDRRAVADVLHALALGHADPLLLLLDVRHEPRVRAGRDPGDRGGA